MANANDLQIKLLLDVVDKHLGKIGEMADQLKKVNSAVAAVDRAQQRMGQHAQIAGQQSVDAAQKQRKSAKETLMAWGLTSAAIYGAGRLVRGAITSYAALEREIGRIGITADATDEQVQGASKTLYDLASQTAMPMEQVVDGFDALVAAGRSWQDALNMLPAVVKTAQASGANVADIAQTADAAATSMGLTAEQMMLAFDKMAKGGKMGKFELREMAAYLPSILPMMQALGYTGQEGLEKTIALIQTMHTKTGTASEAATNLVNVLGKMYSPETAKNFKKYGIDLPAELAKAKKEGKDIIDVFIKLTDKVTGGDMEVFAKLFPDQQYRSGMLTLTQMQEKLKEFEQGVKDAAGTVETDLNRVLGDTQTLIDRLSIGWNEFLNDLGKTVLKVGGIEVVEDAIRRMADLRGIMEVINGNMSFSDWREQFNLHGAEGDIGGAAFIDAYKAATGGQSPTFDQVKGSLGGAFDDLSVSDEERKKRAAAGAAAGLAVAQQDIRENERADRNAAIRNGGNGGGQLVVMGSKIYTLLPPISGGGIPPLDSTRFVPEGSNASVPDLMSTEHLPSASSAVDVIGQIDRLFAQLGVSIPARELGDSTDAFRDLAGVLTQVVNKINEIKAAAAGMGKVPIPMPNPRANLGPSLPDNGPYGAETR